MDIATLAAVIGAVVWVSGVGIFLGSLVCGWLQPRLQRQRATSRQTPPVSLILPVKLLNQGFQAAQESAFAQKYPTYEVLVGATEEWTPALSIMRRLAAGALAPARILLSNGIGAVSPKLDAMSAPMAQATHDTVLTKDSDITMDPDVLSAMLRSFTEDVGLVVAVPVARSAKSGAGRIEALIVNHFARLLLTTSAFGKGYGVGKTTLFRRSDLARAGGPTALGYTIAEDIALARAMDSLGLRTVFAEATVGQEIGYRTLRDVFIRQARWAAIRRVEIPAKFLCEPVVCAMPVAVAGALAAPLIGFSSLAAFLITLAGWYGLELVFVAAKRWELSPWTPAAFLARDLVLMLAWTRAWLTMEVNWAGRMQSVRVPAQPALPARAHPLATTVPFSPARGSFVV